MMLTEEQQQTLVLFPEALRLLVHAELASGNSIVEIGHTFPATPAGAYIMLANTVSTRPRDSDSVLSYRARYSAISSGEFTDSHRVYFVLEPPSPPQPEIDMDAIRREHTSREDALVARAQEVRSVKKKRGVTVAPAPQAGSAKKRRAGAVSPRPPVDRDFLVTSSPSGVEYAFLFDDTRPPHEVQFALERAVRVLFSRGLEHDRLYMRANARVNGASFALTLQFLAATLKKNSYSLHVACSWTAHRPEDDDYFRRTSRSWLKLWTKDLGPTAAARKTAGSAERYRALTDEAMRSESHLDSVAALQQAVVAGLQHGGTYVHSHKEGGTEFAWRHGAFVRTDHGDDPDVQKYVDETSFLRALRQFCHLDVISFATEDSVSELDEWRLILRFMGDGLK